MNVAADTANSVVWDSASGRYLAFTRRHCDTEYATPPYCEGKVNEWGVRREVRSRTATADFGSPWSYASEVAHGEAHGTYDMYSMVPFRADTWRAGLYFAVGSYYAGSLPQGRVYCELLVSSNSGANWTRLAPHVSFIPLGEDGAAFDSHTCYAANGLVGSGRAGADPRAPGAHGAGRTRGGDDGADDSDDNAADNTSSNATTRFYYAGGNGPHSGGGSIPGRSNSIGLATAMTHALAGIGPAHNNTTLRSNESSRQAAHGGAEQPQTSVPAVVVTQEVPREEGCVDGSGLWVLVGHGGCGDLAVKGIRYAGTRAAGDFTVLDGMGSGRCDPGTPAASNAHQPGTGAAVTADTGRPAWRRVVWEITAPGAMNTSTRDGKAVYTTRGVSCNLTRVALRFQLHGVLFAFAFGTHPPDSMITKDTTGTKDAPDTRPGGSGKPRPPARGSTASDAGDTNAAAPAGWEVGGADPYPILWSSGSISDTQLNAAGIVVDKVFNWSPHDGPQPMTWNCSIPVASPTEFKGPCILSAWPLLQHAGAPAGLPVVNGGVPQAANVSYHLDLIRRTLPLALHEDFDGVASIDFENWTPIWEDNGSHDAWHSRAYQDYSVALINKQTPGLSPTEAEARAKVGSDLCVRPGLPTRVAHAHGAAADPFRANHGASLGWLVRVHASSDARQHSMKFI